MRSKKNNKNNLTESFRHSFQQSRIAYWDAVARKLDQWTGWGGYYHHRLEEIYRFLIIPGHRVLEIGCGKGDLLAAVKPSTGVGIDFSGEMLSRARKRHSDLRFIKADAHDFNLNEKFDYIVLSDLVNDLFDVQAVFERMAAVSTPFTRIIINSYSRLWELPLALVTKLGMANARLYQNWLTVEDITGLLTLANFEVIRHWEEILWPLSTPVLASLANRYLVRIWPFKLFALTNFIIARPDSSNRNVMEKPLVSVIIPARNEAGNIPQIFSRIPEMGAGTELVLVEGHSSDNTYGVIEEAIANNPERPCQLLRQQGVGKGDAVRLGFSQAKGDILIILDADLTVPPEDLPRFFAALVSGMAEFVNGVRLVYPMEEKAMRFINLLGNKFFSLAFTWLLGQPVKDTLCGTKALWKSEYKKIEANRAYFGDFDPFGDFDLLFGATKLDLKILDLPIRYRERSYGKTNIKRWSHGWLLLKMLTFAAKRIKFI
jgi:ubiquinone/menaquinone biosynthesis C-methylase UbiE